MSASRFHPDSADFSALFVTDNGVSRSVLAFRFDKLLRGGIFSIDRQGGFQPGTAPLC